MALPVILLGLAGAGGALLGAGMSSKEPRAKVNDQKQNIIHQTQDTSSFMNEPSELNELNNSLPQDAFKSTNVGWLDEKLKNGTASAYDAYLAKQYLDIDLSEYGRQSMDVNLNGKLSMTNLNKLYDNANNVVANAELYDAVLASGKGNIGLGAEIVRDLHELIPFSPIGKENNKYRNFQNAMAWAAAIDATNGGKPNRYTQEHFMNMYQHNARGEREQASLMAAALKQNNIALKKNIEQIAQLRGGAQNVPKQYYERYKKNKAMIADLSNDQFNYDAFLKKYKLNSADQSYQNYLQMQTRMSDEPANEPRSTDELKPYQQNVVERD